jgi:hypothetical protein
MHTRHRLQNRSAPRRASIYIGGAVLLALAGGACSGEPEPETQGQNIVIPPVEWFLMEGLKIGAGKAAGAAFDWWWNSLLGNDPAGDLQRNFDNIEWHIKEVEGKVKALTYVTKQFEVNDVTRQADSDREMKVKNALYTSAAFPHLAAMYEFDALGVAGTWLTQSHYTFAGTGEQSPTRFDFRIASPLVVEAVNAWLVLRAIADKYAAEHNLPRHPLDAMTKEKLRKMSYDLDARTTTAINIVHCDERRTPRYTKRGNERVLTGCTYSYSCEDGIAQTFVWDRPSRVAEHSPCQAAVIRRQAETDEMRAKYNAWPYYDIAAKWREVSGP